MLKIGEKFAITSDETCVTVHIIKVSQSGENKGKEYLSPKWYFPNFEQAFESLLEKGIMISDIEDFSSAIVKAKEEILTALHSTKGKSFIKKATSEEKIVPEKDTIVPEKRTIVPEKCTKHPKYKGMRRPRSGCETCMEIYNNKKKI